MNSTQLALHRARCRDPYCGSCETAAERRSEAADEPLSPGEDDGRQNAYERGMGF